MRCKGTFKKTGKEVEQMWTALAIPSLGQGAGEGIDIVDEYKCDKCGNITTRHKVDSRLKHNMCGKRVDNKQ